MSLSEHVAHTGAAFSAVRASFFKILVPLSGGTLALHRAPSTCCTLTHIA